MRIHTPSVTALALLVTLTACSRASGSAAGSTPADASLSLTVDTAAGTEDTLSITPQVVALERLDGTVTDNLLAAPQELVLTDPAGASSGLALADTPAGTYRALRLLLVSDMGSCRRKDGGRVPVRLGGLELRLALAEELRLPQAEPCALLLRHAKPVVVRDLGSGNLAYEPQLVVAPFLGEPLHHVRLRITKVDAPNFRADALWVLGNRQVPIRLTVAADATLLTHDHKPLTRTGFVDLLAPGSEMRADGRLSARRELLLTRARLHEDEAKGPCTALVGRVLEVFPASLSFTLQVYDIRHGGAGIHRHALPVLTVYAAGAEIRRETAPLTQAPFTLLAPGRIVEIEYQGVAKSGQVIARSIELTSE